MHAIEFLKHDVQVANFSRPYVVLFSNHLAIFRMNVFVNTAFDFLGIVHYSSLFNCSYIFIFKNFFELGVTIKIATFVIEVFGFEESNHLSMDDVWFQQFMNSCFQDLDASGAKHLLSRYRAIVLCAFKDTTSSDIVVSG